MRKATGKFRDVLAVELKNQGFKVQKKWDPANTET
jgi:hypothetical protein